MMKIQIIPYIGFDVFKLGMNKAEINTILGNRYNHSTYDYTADQLDDYFEDGIMIDYNDAQICISAHLCVPSKAMFRGIDLLQASYQQICNMFSEETQAYRQEQNFLFLDSGIAFSFNENLKSLLVVTVFTKDLFFPYLNNYEKVTL